MYAEATPAGTFTCMEVVVGVPTITAGVVSNLTAETELNTLPVTVTISPAFPDKGVSNFKGNRLQ